MDSVCENMDVGVKNFFADGFSLWFWRVGFGFFDILY